MKQVFYYNCNSQRGAALLEYAMALGILLVTFLMLGSILGKGAIERGQLGERAAGSAVPYVNDSISNGANILNNSERF